ncbi:MAG: hypothetical protein WBE26_20010, partial [Phycisphaerae bacterium]
MSVRRLSANGDQRAAYRIKAAGLVLSLVASAYLMAHAITSPGYSWLGWLTLLPLFFAIRVCRPVIATLSGAVWGFSLFA